jgi:hypothetical protein
LLGASSSSGNGTGFGTNGMTSKHTSDTHKGSGCGTHAGTSGVKTQPISDTHKAGKFTPSCFNGNKIANTL